MSQASVSQPNHPDVEHPRRGRQPIETPAARLARLRARLAESERKEAAGIPMPTHMTPGVARALDRAAVAYWKLRGVVQ